MRARLHGVQCRIPHTATTSIPQLERPFVSAKLSMAIAAGAEVKVVQQILGHADASMTVSSYADLWPDRLDEVVSTTTIQRREALGLLSS